MKKTISVTRVHIDRGWIETNERLLPLARFLFGIRETALPTFRDEFTHNMTFENVELAESAEESDFIYLPVNYSPSVPGKYTDLIDETERLSAKTNKTVVVQAHSKDVVDPGSLELPFSNAVYLNAALIKSLSPENFHALPYFIPDCLERYFGGELNVLDKTDKPTVGFCGVAAPLETPFNKTKVFDYFRLALTATDNFGFDSERLARSLGTNMKHAHRTRAIMHLRKSKMVDTDFILRSQGGLVTNQYTNSDDKDSYNVEFYENLSRNLYSLCARGTENYSVRFYETFCLGRIPILLDTDISLPFESKIDYEYHCVVIPKTRVRDLSKCLVNFHETRPEKVLRKIQRKNRAIWEHYFSNTEYFSVLVGDFE